MNVWIYKVRVWIGEDDGDREDALLMLSAKSIRNGEPRLQSLIYVTDFSYITDFKSKFSFNVPSYYYVKSFSFAENIIMSRTSIPNKRFKLRS
jgi:hypothetical protein